MVFPAATRDENAVCYDFFVGIKLLEALETFAEQ